MPITGSERYRRAFDAKGFEVTCRKGTSRVSGIAASTKPNLYITSVAGWPIYDGKATRISDSYSDSQAVFATYLA